MVHSFTYRKKINSLLWKLMKTNVSIYKNNKMKTLEKTIFCLVLFDDI